MDKQLKNIQPFEISKLMLDGDADCDDHGVVPMQNVSVVLTVASAGRKCFVIGIICDPFLVT